MGNIIALSRLEQELKKVETYSWGGLQTNMLDDLTKFIYGCSSYDALMKLIERAEGIHENFPRQYAINRWYNFWCSTAAEALLGKSDKVELEKEVKHKTIDFFIEQLNFDLKVTVLPKVLQNGFNNGFAAFKHFYDKPQELIYWFYENQSIERRFHEHNRLFLVCADLVNPEESWKLKRELRKLRNLLEFYAAKVNVNKVPVFEINDGEARSDVLFFLKGKERFRGYISKFHDIIYHSIWL
ncbi:hypothetical protein KY330_04395 [Candidatus Woesearchaeota archaeon]|nr:hypothetical protein [Candidatus Woesearchaeota archaeon]